MIFGHPYAVVIAAVVVGTIATARLNRLLVNDHWPPVEWLRGKWDTWTNDEAHPRRQGWWLLLHCPWCIGPWSALVVGVPAVLSDLAWWWFAGATWFAVAYVASWLTFHDEDGADH